MCASKCWVPCLAPLLVTLTVTGCDKTFFAPHNVVSGSGTIAAEERQVASFTSIVLNGIGHVELTQGSAQPVVVEADDNLLPLITSEVDDDTLQLGIKDNQAIRPSQPIRFVFQMPAITKLAIHGSGQIDAKDLDADELTVSVAGSADIMATGRVPELTVAIDGSGNFRGQELETSRTHIRTNGAGNAVVNASDALAVAINGVGTVEYVGDPKVTKSINGVGTVRPREGG